MSYHKVSSKPFVNHMEQTLDRGFVVSPVEWFPTTLGFHKQDLRIVRPDFGSPETSQIPVDLVFGKLNQPIDMPSVNLDDGPNSNSCFRYYTTCL
jgi:hypothetical protein